MFCVPLLLQPAASAHANQSDWATAERRTAATTDGRALRLLMVESRDAECMPISSRSPILQTRGVSLSSARWRGRVRRRIAPSLRRLSRQSARQLRTMRERSRLPRGRLMMTDTNAGCAAFVAWVHPCSGSKASRSNYRSAPSGLSRESTHASENTPITRVFFRGDAGSGRAPRHGQQSRHALPDEQATAAQAHVARRNEVPRVLRGRRTQTADRVWRLRGTQHCRPIDADVVAAVPACAMCFRRSKRGREFSAGSGPGAECSAGTHVAQPDG